MLLVVFSHFCFEKQSAIVKVLLYLYFSMTYNPWDVDSIKSFSYLKCPECVFESQEEDIFQNHATENHPLSFVFFGGKKEEDDDEDYYGNFGCGVLKLMKIIIFFC